MNYVIGKTIRELREKQKLTQKELAKALGTSITPIAIGMVWCNNRYRK